MYLLLPEIFKSQKSQNVSFNPFMVKLRTKIFLKQKIYWINQKWDLAQGFLARSSFQPGKAPGICWVFYLLRSLISTWLIHMILHDAVSQLCGLRLRTWCPVKSSDSFLWRTEWIQFFFGRQVTAVLSVTIYSTTWIRKIEKGILQKKLWFRMQKRAEVKEDWPLLFHFLIPLLSWGSAAWIVLEVFMTPLYSYHSLLFWAKVRSSYSYG
jgi:hypothetical protein